MDYSGWSGTGAFAPVVQKRYGGFWIRVVAYLLDSIILTLVQLILVQLLENPGQVLLASALCGWLYFAGCESALGATPGKMVFGMTVTDERGNGISFLHATGRYFAKILSGLILGIGYLMVAWSDRKQGLHDQIAGTLVMRSGGQQQPQRDYPYINM